MSFKSSTSSLFAKKAADNEPDLDKVVAKDATATDTMSCLRWSPKGNHLAAVSWDGKMRVYSVAADLRANGVAMMAAEAPLLSCDWSKVSDVV